MSNLRLQYIYHQIIVGYPGIRICSQGPTQVGFNGAGKRVPFNMIGTLAKTSPAVRYK